MSRSSSQKAAVTLIAAAILAVALAACGSSSSSSSETTGSSESAGSTTAASAGGDEVAAAKKVVEPFIGHPSPFPVTEKLKKRPTGAHFAYVETGTPIAALFWQLMGPAAQTMGVSVERFNAGTSANTATAAFDSVVAKQPDAAIIGSIPPEVWSKQLKELQDTGTVLTGSGIINGSEYGLEPVQAGSADDERNGKLMANYVVAEMNPEANVVVYSNPELPLIDLIAEVFSKELEAICSKCSVRTVEIPAHETGNTAPTTIVSDLQAHPETDLAVFANDEIQTGLPQALQAAGIEIETLGFGPSPANLQYLKEGKETAALGYDIPVLVWTLVDQAARELAGQKLSGPEAEGVGVVQFLTQQDINFDPSHGWTGYPDFAEKFAKLWGAGE